MSKTEWQSRPEDDARRRRKQSVEEWCKKAERPLTAAERDRWAQYAPRLATEYLWAKPAALQHGRLEPPAMTIIEETFARGVPTTYFDMVVVMQVVTYIRKRREADEALEKL